jgi:serine/threonine-protein kinase RsbW
MPLQPVDLNFSRRLPAQPDSVREFKEKVKAVGLAMGFSEEVLFRIELALEEVLVNIVNYAYSEQEQPGWVDVECRAESATRLMLEVRDGGKPFNPLELEQPDTGLPVSERDIGGLGVFLTRKMADQLSYEREGGVNRLTLVFDSAKTVNGAEDSDHLPAIRGRP